MNAAFRHHWRALALSYGSASALPEDVGPFAGFCPKSRSHREDLLRLLNDRTEPIITLRQSPNDLPAAVKTLSEVEGVQMVYDGVTPKTNLKTLERLGEADEAEMLALARATRPGPFERRSHKLGKFLGLRKRQQLVAMVGQRMRFGGWTEISALCVRPTMQNTGLGTRLLTAMIAEIVQSGNRPFLHVYASNTKAISLYQRLGFRVRQTVWVASLTRAT